MGGMPSVPCGCMYTRHCIQPKLAPLECWRQIFDSKGESTDCPTYASVCFYVSWLDVVFAPFWSLELWLSAFSCWWFFSGEPETQTFSQGSNQAPISYSSWLSNLVRKAVLSGMPVKLSVNVKKKDDIVPWIFARACDVGKQVVIQILTKSDKCCCFRHLSASPEGAEWFLISRNAVRWKWCRREYLWRRYRCWHCAFSSCAARGQNSWIVSIAT